ncbi:phage integrase [Hydrogenovibrio crunogenus]|uniref:Phage integrase n=1 Tax=Hydrogenovibrio crunogenus TaxID=39765 RepID=A0A4P7NX86_9GAMM|nr:integrase arm-type DNA-binding domain-containing protein [Hydrogenovibrio crunogenus]QBZ82361.1 phage integrase [Hydrogenovibrio crunogenus]
MVKEVNFNVLDVDSVVSSLNAQHLEITHKDGHSFPVMYGLYLKVSLKNKKTWRLRYKDLNGKYQFKKLGDFPSMRFDEAKQKMTSFNSSLEARIDPFKKEKEEQKVFPIAKLKFKDAFAKFCDFKRGNGNIENAKWMEGTLEQHIKIFNKHVLPKIGDEDVSNVTVQDLTKVLKDIEAVGSLTIRDKTLKAFRGMYSWMVGQYINDGDHRYPSLNIANSITKDTFIQRKPKNFKHVTTVSDVKRLVNKVYNLNATFEIRQALKIQLHLFLRPGPLSELLWSDVRFLEDLEVRTKEDKYDLLEIPKERMKMNADYLSTLSPQVRKLFLELREVTGHSDYVFLSPYRSGDNRPITRDSLLSAMKRNGIDDTTTHGFRHMASTLLRDELGFDQDASAIEVQLSHTIGGDRRVLQQSKIS